MAGKQPSRKRRLQEKTAKKRQEARRKAAQGHLVLGGQVVNLECRLDLLLCHPSDRSLNRQITALIDTGATCTCVRSDIMHALGLPVIHQTSVRAFGGNVPADVVSARMVLMSEGKSVSKLRPMVVGDVREMNDELIFGMDALVGGILTVDMVKGSWEWRLMRMAKRRKQKRM